MTENVASSEDRNPQFTKLLEKLKEHITENNTTKVLFFILFYFLGPVQML